MTSTRYPFRWKEIVIADLELIFCFLFPFFFPLLARYSTLVSESLSSDAVYVEAQVMERDSCKKLSVNRHGRFLVSEATDCVVKLTLM